MAIPMIGRKLTWGKLGKKAKESARRAAEKWARYRHGREQLREIGILKKSLGIPRISLKAHFEMRAKELENAGKTKNDIFDIVIQDLQKMKQLSEQTKPKTTSEIINRALLGSLNNKKMTLSEVIQRMEEKAQEQQQGGQQQRRAA